MNKFLSTIAVILLGYFLLSSTVFAQTECQPIYGGGQTCVQVGDITINKTVQKPDNSGFVDNLSINDPKFRPEQTVTFRLTIKNNGDREAQKITVRDTFPQYLSFVDGQGKFDQNSQVFTFDIDKLNANETKTYTVRGKIVPVDQIPANQNITCVVNQASATSNDRESVDNAQFCIERQATNGTPAPTVPPTTKGGLKIFPEPQTQTTPKTGPAEVAMFSLMGSGAAGYYMRKLSFKKQPKK
jgi:uncharacterized repeat protein (TIGR01451 family)